MKKKFKWTVEFTVNETWVADGFDIDDDRAKEMLANDLQYAYGHEISARIIKAPNKNDILIAQGYKPVKK